MLNLSRDTIYISFLWSVINRISFPLETAHFSKWVPAFITGCIVPVRPSHIISGSMRKPLGGEGGGWLFINASYRTALLYCFNALQNPIYPPTQRQPMLWTCLRFLFVFFFLSLVFIVLFWTSAHDWCDVRASFGTWNICHWKVSFDRNKYKQIWQYKPGNE